MQAASDRDLTRQGQVSARFTTAIGQLGSNHPEVQIGGIYGLEQITRQAPENRLAVTEVLTTYVHRRAARPAAAKPPHNPSASQSLRSRAPDVQAALTVLGRRVTQRDDPILDLHGLDLHNADLFVAEFPRTGFSEVDLTNADLANAKFTYSTFSGADLSGADLSGADLNATDFTRAHLDGADLRHAALKGADLRSASLTRANLQDASADQYTQWPPGFDWRRAGVRFDRSELK